MFPSTWTKEDEGKSESQVENNSRNYCRWTEEEDAIIISNKKDKKTNKHIASLLEGKSESQVKNHADFLMRKGTLKTVAKKCFWTKEEDAIIISNKKDNKTNEHIATLLEGKSEYQIKNHAGFLMRKGTLKTVANTVAMKCFWTKEDDAIIISNKNDKKTNMHIASLLEGKSESQVKNHADFLMRKGTLKTVANTVAKKCFWTKEEDDIIISNKNDSNTIKYTASLLEGRSEYQVQYRYAVLISKEKLDPSYLKLSWTKEDDDIIINNKKDYRTNKDIAQLLNGKTKVQVKQRSAILIKEGRLETRQKMIAKKCLWTKEEDAIIISNKNDKKSNMHIATLLEGKSESQVQYRSATLIENGTLKTIAKKCLWTEEEDAIIISNKNDKKSNKHIATLLEGKSESQVHYRSATLIENGTLKTVAKLCLWTEEEDAIIISNKNDKKSNKHIATLLEGKSKNQVQYRSATLIEKGTLKTVAKKKKAPVIKTRIAPKASKFRFTVNQKYKPTSNKKQKLMDERVENLSEDVEDSKNNCIPVCTKSIYNIPSLASKKFHQNPPLPDSSDSSSDNDSSDNDSSNDSSSDESSDGSSDGSSDDEDDNDNCIPVCTTSIYDMPSSVSDIFHLGRPILSSKGIIPDGTSSLFNMPSSVSDKFHLHLSSTKSDDDLFGFNFDFENDSLPHH